MISADSFSGAKVLVTGASGFIGGHLSRRLTSQGAQVHGTTRRLSEGRASDVRWVATALDDEAALTKLLDSVKPDVLFHLAGLTSGSRSLEMVLPNLQANLVTTLNVLTAAQAVGCARIVLAGSMEVPRHGEFVAGSPYGVAKHAAQLYARLFAGLYGTPVTVARIFMVYGPGDAAVQRLVPYVICSLLRGNRPKLTSGNREIDWIYVDDVVEGLMRVALTPGLIGEVVDIGTGHAETVRAVVERLAGIAGSGLAPEFGAVPDRPLESIAVADVDRSTALVGWKPVIGLDEGLRRTFEYYWRVLTDKGQLAADGEWRAIGRGCQGSDGR